MSARGNVGAGRLGTGNDGADHSFRQRVDNIYQIRADCKKKLSGTFKLMGVRNLSSGSDPWYFADCWRHNMCWSGRDHGRRRSGWLPGWDPRRGCVTAAFPAVCTAPNTYPRCVGLQLEQLAVPVAVIGMFSLSCVLGHLSIRGLTPSATLLVFYMLAAAAGCLCSVLHIGMASIEIQVLGPCFSPLPSDPEADLSFGCRWDSQKLGFDGERHAHIVRPIGTLCVLLCVLLHVLHKLNRAYMKVVEVAAMVAGIFMSVRVGCPQQTY
jgi:hypothetical protein